VRANIANPLEIYIVREMTTAHTKVFKGNRSQAVRLPKSVALPESIQEVDIVAIGKPIGPYDMMIVGHARSMGLILVTNNLNEFERVPGLRVENWV
jgi:predicted nucleic acid-binding protein